jgi:hypothetical protein
MPELLTLENIGQIKRGALGLQINDLLNRALKDCDDRPNLEDARKLVISIDISPEFTDGVDSTVLVEGSAKLSLPGMKKLSESLALLRGEDEKGQAVVEAVMPYPTQDAPGQKNLYKNEGGN